MTSFINADGTKIALSEFWKPRPIHPPVRDSSELSYLGRTIRWLREVHPSVMEFVLNIFKNNMFVPNDLVLLGWGFSIGLGVKYDMRILWIYSGVMLAGYLFNIVADIVLEEYRTQINEEKNEEALLNPKPGSYEERELEFDKEMKKGAEKIQALLNLNPDIEDVPIISPKREIRSSWEKGAVKRFSYYFLDDQPASSPLFVGRNNSNFPYLFLRVRPKNTQDNSFWITLFPNAHWLASKQKFDWEIIVEKSGERFKLFNNDLSMTVTEDDVLYDNGPSFALIEELISGKHKDFEIDFDISLS